MKRVTSLFNSLAEIEKRTPEYIVSSSADKSVWYRSLVSWVAIRVCHINQKHVASAFGFTRSRDVDTYGCRRIDKEIIKKNIKTLDLLNLLLWRLDEKSIPEPIGVCSPSVLYANVSKYIPQAQENPQTETNDSNRKSAECASAANQYFTSQRGLLSTIVIQLSLKEAIGLTKKNELLTTKSEENLHATALFEAILWGKMVKAENTERMSQLNERASQEDQEALQKNET